MLTLIKSLFTSDNLKGGVDFVKKYWYIFFICGVLIYSHMRISNIEKVLTLTQDSMQAQMIEQKKVQEESSKKQADLLNSYQQEVTRITEDYGKKLQSLQVNRNKQVQKLTDSFDKNPKDIAQQITNKFGVTYVP